MTKSEIIERLEKASEGSRDLDADVARAIGNKVEIVRVPDGHPIFKEGGGLEFMVLPTGQRTGIPPYSQSLDAALPGEDINRIERVQSPSKTWWNAYQEMHCGTGATEALARRIAALKATP